MRLFKTSDTRKTKDLGGLWHFKIDPDRIGMTAGWYRHFPAEAEKMCVPACWNCTPEYFSYSGFAWYMTSFTVESEEYLLSFDGILDEAAVYIDGEEVGCHYGGFTPFTVRGHGKGTHTLVLSVDNTHADDATIPALVVDWYHYGGIWGDVTLTELTGAYIETHRISYTLEGDTAHGKVEFDIVGEYRGRAELFLDGVSLGTVPAETGHNAAAVEFGEISRWCPENPRLYTLQIKIETDDIRERIGFRTIVTHGSEILLNGRQMHFKAINRHNEHPDFGFSLPLPLLKRDADIIKDMGCNLIRGSHYPNPPAFLDYLDEIGMLFWEEIPMWGNQAEALAAPIVRERGMAMHKEMVQRDYHHPSIIFWGLHNEVATDTKEGYETTKAFADCIRQADSTRLLTFASLHLFDDICFEFADVISINAYAGWYGGYPADDPDIGKAWEWLTENFFDYLKKTGEYGKPVMISEFGAGAIYGETTLYETKWSENYQAELLEKAISHLAAQPEIKGLIVWQFCDIRVVTRALSRPRGFNNKGVLNECRKPKMGYYALKKIYSKIWQ